MNSGKRIDFEEEAFEGRAELGRHLAYESFLALARHSRRELVVDYTLERRGMKAGFLLVVAYMLSKELNKRTQKKRVGIVFPPGLGGYLANLAVVLSGKVPVNLNFTLGRASAEACLKKADIDCLLTTERVRQKVPGFPWPKSGVIDLVEVMKDLAKVKTLGLLGAIALLPSRWLARWLKIPREGGDLEAGLLFTSGSSGEPKGVVLTHRNILCNCAQIDATGLLTDAEKLMANLPIFHSFGFTVTLWYPLLRGCPVVSVPSPLEVKKIAHAIEKEGVTALLGTPTFLKPYLKRVNVEQLRSLKYVIAGAEKTPEGFAEAWEKRFGGRYLEGYGLTETSPVVSLNLPEELKGPGSGEGAVSAHSGSRAGSVGRPLPGISARILDPETMEDLEPTSAGLLLLKGPNIFQGYLDEPDRTGEVLRDGWFTTGDLARFDGDGFLFIEGRLSRFSKIGGEMVPHGTVESILIQAYELEESEVPLLAVAGRADANKGEVLVLLSVMEVEVEEVREKLIAAGLSNLWMPKEVRWVEAIPTLATGKLDLRGIQALAESGETSEEI